jgi:hypothetical protein
MGAFMTDKVQAAVSGDAHTDSSAIEVARREADDIPAAGILRLAIGLIQGLALYFLERQREKHGWPATDHYLFMPLASVALLIPVFVLQAAGRMSRMTLAIWSIVATGAVAGLGWYDVYRQAPDPLSVSGGMPTFPFLFFTFVALFITQSLIAAGDADASFLTRYRNYFDSTWKFGVQLALAAAFVGAFWAMLWLGAALFDLIKLSFLRKLIDHSWFSIPATTLAVATAIHLTDVRAQLVAGIRSVGLTLLSWLLPLMAILVAAFMGSLTFTGLAPLWETRWAVRILLVAAAVLVVLINAAYQDGEAESARPLVLRYAELVASILLIPLVILAAYALALRVQQYGWTIDRVATLACVLVAACYALGYTAAALFSLLGGQWMWALESVNIFVAFLILVILAALFTPVADPARLSALSQVARLQAGITKPAAFDFGYLHSQGGRYGIAALKQLANLKSGPNAPEIRRLASQLLGPTRPPAKPTAAEIAQNISVYPATRKLPPMLLAQTPSPIHELTGQSSPCLTAIGIRCSAFFADIFGDGKEEIVLVSGSDDSWNGVVYAPKVDGSWEAIAAIAPPRCAGALDAMRAGRFRPVPPRIPTSMPTAAQCIWNPSSRLRLRPVPSNLS